MKKHIAIIVSLLLMNSLAFAAGGVSGSPHDLSQESWNTRKGVCSPCHAAHHTDQAQIVPLWVHATTAATFTPYNSPTLNASIGNPDGVSLACLSCHDGTIALNANLSNPNPSSPVYIDEGAIIGPDLHTTHPISFTYDAALANDDGGLENPITYNIGDAKIALTDQTAPVPTSWSGTSLIGKSIDEALLTDHKMQCSSCHDVHKQEGSAPSSGILIKISGNDINNRGSLICRTCHIK